MLSAITSVLRALTSQVPANVHVGLASVVLLMTSALASAVEVSLVPVASVGYETNTVPATMKLVRSSSGGALDVRLSLDPDSVAQIGSDYTVSGTGIADTSFATTDPFDSTDLHTSLITIPDGQSEVLITIAPLEDSLVEARESMVFNIKPKNGAYVIGAPSSMSLTIADNDHKARIQVPDPVADEDSALFGLVSDPDIQRRAVMRVRFDKFLSSTRFTRNLAVDFVTSGGTQPIATLGTDYGVKYKICGNSNGVTEERSRIGYDKVNIRGTGLGYTLIAHLVGETQISISGASSTDDVLPSGSTLRFSNHSTVYTVASAGPNGIVLNAPGLTANLPNGTGITVLSIGGTGTAEPPTNLVVQRIYPAGSTSINVDFGSGGLFVGDVFQIEGHSGFYVVTSDTGSLIGTRTGTVAITSGSTSVTGTGTSFTTQLVVGDYIFVSGQRRRVSTITSATALTVDANFTVTASSVSYQTDTGNMSSGSLVFRRYQGAGTGGGLEVDTGGSPKLTTLIDATVASGRMQVLVPEESSKVEISVTPVANDGAEGVEEVRMRMIADEDYELLTPQEASVYIADRDVSTSISVVSNAGLPNQTGFFKVAFSKSFPRSITVPYLVTDSLTGPGPSDEYNETLPGSVTLIAGQTEALIQVDPISKDSTNTPYSTPQSLTLTLIAGLNYKLSGSTSSGVNPSATMNIANSVGAVTIAASTPTASESATAPANGQFTLTINRNSGQTGAIGVTLNVAGTAVNGSRYEFVSATGSVITPVNNQILVTIPAGAAPGTTTTTVGVRPINNFLADGDQIVQLSIVDGTSYLVGTSSSTASVTIDDDEPTVSVSAVNDATRPATPGFFRFSYDGSALSQAVQVNFTYGGSGVINTDYTASTTVTIPSNSTSTTLAINPIDTADGSAETVTVTINPASTYTIGTSSASLNIKAATSTSGNKATPGSVTSSKSSGCGLGSGLAGFLTLGLMGLVALRRRSN